MSVSTTEDLGTLNLRRPLTRRARSAAVEAELAALAGLPIAQIIRRVATPDKTRQAAPETLVSLARTLEQAGRINAADKIAGQLMVQVGIFIRRELARWPSLENEREDAEQQMRAKLCEYVFSDSTGEEFWECNFHVCFERRMTTLLAGLARAKPHDLSLTRLDADGQEQDCDLPDESASGPREEFEMTDMIDAVSRADDRLGQAIYLRLAGYGDAEIAAKFGVSDRTIRNWMTMAQKEYARLNGEPPR